MYAEPTLVDVVEKLEKRISDLENPSVGPVDISSGLVANLSIVGLTSSATHYVDNGTPRIRVHWEWTDIINTTDEDRTRDYAVKYRVWYTTPSYVSPTQEITEAKFDIDPAIGATVYTLHIIAVSGTGREGPEATNARDSSKDTTAPPQPSTPTVAAALKGVKITWNGLDVTAAAMPTDFAYCEVHASTSGASFTPSASTLTNIKFYEANVGYLVTDNYTTVYIRLVPVDIWGNKGPASTAGSATPSKAVSTDLSIAMPGDIAYRDEGNLVIDGSFESQAVRDDRTANASKTINVTFTNTAGFASHGSWAVRVQGEATVQYKYMTIQGGAQDAGDIPVEPGTKLYISAKIRGVSANGQAYVALKYKTAAGAQVSFIVAPGVTTSTSTGSYVFFEGVDTVPATAAYLEVSVRTNTVTTGDWYFDQIQVRNIIGTSLIEDAAITNAKIALLAVNDANIASLNAAKITTGELAAGQRIIAGDETLAHAEMTSDGFHSYSYDDELGVYEVVRMGTATNDVFAVTNSTGDPVGSISETGLVAGTGANFVQTGEDADGRPLGVEIYGLDFTDWDRTHGMIITNGSSTNANASGVTSRIGLREISFFAEAGRSYTVHLEFPHVYCTSTAEARALIGIRGTTDGTSPTTSSPVYQTAAVRSSGSTSRVNSPTHMAVSGTFGSDQLVRLLVTFEPYDPAGSTWSIDTNTGNNFQRHLRMWVTDDGWVNENTMITNTGGGGVTEVKTYTAVWKATNSVGYTAGGSVHFYSPQLTQGYYSSANGDSYAYAVFGGNAISGNDGTKTVATAMSGATLLKAEVYLYANHWYYNSGGTAFLRPFNSLSITNAVPTGTVTTSANWPKPGGRWVTLSGATTAIRGVSVGKANSTSWLYYGRFNAYNASSGYPLLRLTYTR